MYHYPASCRNHIVLGEFDGVQEHHRSRTSADEEALSSLNSQQSLVDEKISKIDGNMYGRH